MTAVRSRGVPCFGSGDDVAVTLVVTEVRVDDSIAVDKVAPIFDVDAVVTNVVGIELCLVVRDDVLLIGSALLVDERVLDVELLEAE